MDQRLQWYLFQRQFLFWTVIGIYLLFTIGLIWSLNYLLIRLASPSYFNLICLLFPPVVVIANAVLQFKTYFTCERYDGPRVTGNLETRFQQKMQPILDRIIFQKPIEIHYKGIGGYMSTASTSKSNLLIVSAYDLMASDEELQANLAHEITHMYCNDFLKVLTYAPLQITISLYLILILMMLLLTFPLVSALMIVAGLALLYAQFINLPYRIMETTADGGATILGYGHGLIAFFRGNLDRRHPLLRSFSDHEHDTVRIERIEYLSNKIK